MGTRGQFSGSIPLLLAQPSRAFHAYDTNMEPAAAQDRFSGQYYCEGSSSDYEEDRTSAPEIPENMLFPNDGSGHDDDSMNILRGFMEDLDEKGRLALKKLVSEVKKGFHTKRILREALHELRERPVSEVLEELGNKLSAGGVTDRTTVDRGVIGDFSTSEEEEFEHKLERFKVKTVNIPGVGVVKEEEEEQD